MAALSEIEKLEARWAENPDGRYFAPLADAYRKAGRIDEAITVATGGLSKHPDYLSAHIVLGRCFLAKKDDASARSAFERVLALDPENIIALKSLAEVAERDGATDDARRWLQRLLTIDAMNSEAADDLARLGGPLDGAAPAEAAPAEAEADARVSFADLAPEPVAEAPAPPEEVAVPRTMERAAIREDQARMAQDRTLGLEAVPPMAPPASEPASDLGLESTSFEPPSESVAAPSDLVLDEPVRTEDLAPSEPAPAERVSAIEFMPPAEPTPEPEPVAVAPPAAADLPLIMPEDVTPPEELRRPSLKQVQMVSPEPVESGSGGDELITETMGDLYFKQGLKDQAAAVYRRLLATRPGDAGLKAKLAAIESPPAFSASALGAEAVGSWLRRIARAVLPTPAAAPPPAPEGGPSPMEQAFQASEPEASPAAAEPAGAATGGAEPSGSPARPATDAYSLDQIFGAAGGNPATPPAPPPSAPANVLGASFDEFFGSAPKTETVRPKEAAPAAARQSEDDLSAFNAWLHGLKR